MQRDHAGESRTYAADMPDAEDIGHRAEAIGISRIACIAHRHRVDRDQGLGLETGNEGKDSKDRRDKVGFFHGSFYFWPKVVVAKTGPRPWNLKSKQQ